MKQANDCTPVTFYASVPSLVAGLFCLAVVILAGCAQESASTEAEPVIVGLIAKTEGNPFFVTMAEAALERAEELGVELRTYSGAYDGDTLAQIRAIEELVEAGAKGILITPSDPLALAPAVEQARAEGVLVIALDTPFDPPDTVDATFATDNFRAGELIGVWAREKLGPRAALTRIATLDGYETPVTVDVMRNQGFLHGFGIDIKDPGVMYDEDDPRIAGSASTMASEAGGRSAMKRLMGMDPSIRLVYAINEPAAAGAYAALRSMGHEREVLIVTIDGACSGVRSVASGEFGATAMQYPVRMASLGIEAVVEFVRTGQKPQPPTRLDFHDTGVALVSAEPVAGVPSIDAHEALTECWGASLTQ